MNEAWRARVRCGGRHHYIVMTDKGRLILPNHSREEIDREMVIAALDGEPCQCVKGLLWWRQHVPCDADLFWRYKRRRRRRSGPVIIYPPGLKKLALKAYQTRQKARDRRVRRRAAGWRAPLVDSPLPKERRWRGIVDRARHLATCARWRWRGGLGTAGKDSFASGYRFRRRRGFVVNDYKFVGMGKLFPPTWEGRRVHGHLSPRGLYTDMVAYLNMRARLRIGVVQDGKWYAMMLAVYQQDERKCWEGLALRRIPPARGRKLTFAVQHCIIRRVRGFRWEVAEWLGKPLFVAKHRPMKVQRVRLQKGAGKTGAVKAAIRKRYQVVPPSGP